MKKFFALALLAAVSTAGAQNIITDDFESYADTAAVEAAWTASATAQAVLTTDAGNAAEGGDKYLAFPATAQSLSRTFTPITIASGVGVSLTYFTRAADWTNTRVSVNVRPDSFTADTYLSVGTTNSIVGDKFGVRVLGWPGVDPALTGTYGLIDSGIDRPVDEWVKLGIAADDAEIRTYINDVRGNDWTVTGAPTTPAGGLRIGYGVSTNLPIDIDNIVLDQVTALPEGLSSLSDWEMMF